MPLALLVSLALAAPTFSLPNFGQLVGVTPSGAFWARARTGPDTFASELALYDPTTGRVLRAVNLPGRYQPVVANRDGSRFAAFDADTTRLTLLNADGRELWSVSSPGLSGTLNLSFSPDGALLVAGNDNGYVQFWNAASGERETTVLGPGYRAELVRFDPAGARLFVQFRGARELVVYDVASRRVLTTLNAYARTPGSLAFTPNGRQFVLADGYTPVRVLDANSGALLRTFPPLKVPCEVPPKLCARGPFTLDLDAEGERLAVAYYNGTAVLYDFASGTVRATLPKVGVYVKLTPSGMKLLGTTYDATGQILNVWPLPAKR